MNHIFKTKFKASMLVLIASILSVLMGCGASETVQLGEADTPTELGNQLGDVMASIDDAGKGTTTISQYTPSFDRYNMSSPKQVAFENVFKVLLPDAMAATCGAATFGTCSSNTMTRNFNGCSIGSYVLTGTVTMTWVGGTNCALTAQSQSIRMVPNYTVAGNNMTLSATKTGTNGITLTLTTSGTPGVWSYSNDGINRTLQYNGTTLLSLNTRTTTALTVTGSARSGRVLNGGTLEVVNSTSGESCTFQPNNVTWGAVNCNCATSGNWTGNCSSLGSVTMSFGGCGLATVSYTENGSPKSKAIALDRCVQN